ncbi:MAG: ADP-ribosylglycohydrolase family protein [Candidatus Melainabacteria bacterium]|nr:ADP-ribosylglycohydrolase family protein [Candidatus Melainabacteria bacterium]
MTGNGLTGERTDKIKGAILGAACGSALGGSCVGLNHKAILGAAGVAVLQDFVPGLTRSRFPGHRVGEVRSDFLLGLSLAEAVVDAGGRFDGAVLRKRFKSLLEDGEFLNSGVGALCLASMRRMVDGLPPSVDRLEAYHSAGAARAFPLGCLPDRSEAVRIAVEQAELTHGNRSVAAAAAVITDSIASFVEGTSLESEDDVRAYVSSEFDLARSIDGRFADFWDDVAPDLDYSRQATDLPYSLVNVQASVNECVPTAVGIFLIFRHDLEAAICSAAIAGGETDTVALVVGSLAGAYHGASRFPSRWLEKLSHREQIERVVKDLLSLWA